MNRARWFVLVLYLLSGAAFVVAEPNITPPWLALVKIIPLILLLVSAIAWAQNQLTRIIVTLALSFSMLGDVLLAYGLFVPGLGAFLVAQVGYALWFYYQRAANTQRFIPMLILISYMTAMATVLYPILDRTLALPVMAYLLVIGSMGLLALNSRYASQGVVLGALVFIASDSLIAINRFLFDIPYDSVLIMSTYYLAQLAIIAGIVMEENPVETQPAKKM